jgi:hypothetical protein
MPSPRSAQPQAEVTIEIVKFPEMGKIRVSMGDLLSEPAERLFAHSTQEAPMFKSFSPVGLPHRIEYQVVPSGVCCGGEYREVRRGEVKDASSRFVRRRQGCA